MANYSEEQLKVLKDSFEKHDADKSGAIDRQEIKNVLASLGISKNEEELNDLFNTVDKDHSGSIEWDEFLNLVHHLNWK